MSSGKVVESIHGAGGTAMGDFLADHVFDKYPNGSAGAVGLQEADDGATVDLSSGSSLVLTTDSHLVKPLFFPGGDIGRLAVCGTVNDLAVMGADPLALTSSLILEEGFSISELESILESMGEALEEAGVPLVTGDTKVMAAGDVDGIVINTAGLGEVSDPIRDAGLGIGDRIIVTGTIGDHGMGLLQYREGLSLEGEVPSDMAPLNRLLRRAREAGKVTAMKDPTRGGLAQALNEMAAKSGVGLIIEEETIPIRDPVRGLSNLLGIDPLEVANEGKAVLGVAQDSVSSVLDALRGHPLGEESSVIGEAREERKGRVVLRTEVGGQRFLEPPSGDPVPRIC